MKNEKKDSFGYKNLGKTIMEDLHGAEFKKSFAQEMREISQIYFDHKTRKRLESMPRIRKWMYTVWYVLKGMFYKLTPTRRVLFLLGFILALSQNQDNRQYGGIALLVLVLLLELKDKLLARDEIEAGRAVQMALLPNESPTIDDWDIWIYTRPANEVGGDLVDYLQLDKDHLGLALGDVAGKGLGAALLTSKLQATWRALAPFYTSLAKFGKQLNAIFCRDGVLKRFASLLYLEISPKRKQVRVLNAGHLPPISIKKGKIQELPKGGPALGLNPEASYTEKRLTLERDDWLIVYSDGLTESRNPGGQFFGEEKLRALLQRLEGLNCECAGKMILEEVNRFIFDAPRTDDLSMILLKRVK